jgi:putative ABC transport system permease protein
VSIAGLAVRNILRNKIRTFLTVCGVAIAIVGFVMLQTVLTAWTAAADHAAKDRIATRHKVTFIMPLPKKYVEDVRKTPGVTDVTWANWFGGKNPNAENEFFATIAVDPPSFLRVYDELVVAEEDKQRWLTNRRGAIIGDVIAKKFGWEVGDKITLQGTIFAGDWEFIIEGIYTATRRSVDRSTLWFHWDYLNENQTLEKDMVGWLISRIDEPGKSAAISKTIDAMFDERDTQTLTMSERDLQMSFLGMLSAILTAIGIVSTVIMLIMMLILGNTIAMGVRERTSEYGVLKAIGFRPRHVATWVIVEALTIGILGAGLGLLLSYPLVEKGLGRFLEENMGAFFPYFRIAGETVVMVGVLAVVLAGVAAAIPAWRASRLKVVDALRRVG